jgi:uncharacterized linocin/CFP29 family protein
MDSLGRDASGLSGRLWQEIDQRVSGVRTSNGTARRFLPVDGPYGLGLTSVAGDEAFAPPGPLGPNQHQWGVLRAAAPPPAIGLAGVSGPGTYMAEASSRSVRLIAGEFILGMRAVEAYEAGCQPIDLCAATTAARDVALEEERLLYYGTSPDDEALLRIFQGTNVTPLYPAGLLRSLHTAIEALAQRGFVGPFALTMEPRLYTALYRPVVWAGAAPGTTVLLVDILRNMFRGGVYMAPVIDPGVDPGLLGCRAGAIVTVGRAYSRLVVGQDWVTAYRGCGGVLHRFLILNSLQLRICEPLSIEVLQLSAADAANPYRYWL